MLNEQQREFIRQQAVRMQIIVAALAAGLLAFLVVALVVSGGRPGAMGPFSYLALGMAVLELFAWALYPGVLVWRGLKSLASGKPPTGQMGATPVPVEVGDVGHLALLFTTRRIIAAAILEGVAFLNVIAYLVEGSRWTLLVAGVLFLMIAGHVPTRTRIEDWVVRQMETLEQMRGASQQ